MVYGHSSPVNDQVQLYRHVVVVVFTISVVVYRDEIQL